MRKIESLLVLVLACSGTLLLVPSSGGHVAAASTQTGLGNATDHERAAAVATLASAGARAPNVTSAPAGAANGTRLPAVARVGPELLQHNGQGLFVTGVNLGNVQFMPFASNPLGSADEMRRILDAALADIAATGANSVRFWLHIDGSRSPAWGVDQAGLPIVSGLPAGLLDDLKWLLRTAYTTHGLLVAMSLWSHDILAVRRLNPGANRARAVRMINDSAATAAYINTALLPMLRALEEPMMGPGTGPRYLDAVLAWEVFNEPEGVSRHWRLYKNYMYAMRYGNYTWWNPATFGVLRQRSVSANLTRSGGRYVGWYFLQDDMTFNNYMYHDVIDNYPSEWDFLKRAIVDDKTLGTVEVPYTALLAFVNRVAGAIHRAAPGAKVTVGVHSMPYATNRPMPGLLWDYDNAPRDYYSDAMLLAAGGDPQGTLDFLQVHGYPIWNEPARDAEINMFRQPKAHWLSSKPIVVGEHWEQVMPMPSIVTPADYVHLHNTGYSGAWGWAYFNVSETRNASSGEVVRLVSEHKCRGSLRSLLAGLPLGLRYPLRRPAAAPQQQQQQAQPAVPLLQQQPQPTALPPPPQQQQVQPAAPLPQQPPQPVVPPSPQQQQQATVAGPAVVLGR